MILVVSRRDVLVACSIYRSYDTKSEISLKDDRG
jgi:hypothetical protein